MIEKLKQLYDEALNDREYVIVWYECEKYKADSIRDLIEQVVRRKEFRERVRKMKTYKDYLDCNSNYNKDNTL